MADDRKFNDKDARRRARGVDPTVQGQIGDQLRQMYDDVVNEPVPDRFLSLLKKLEERGDDKNE